MLTDQAAEQILASDYRGAPGFLLDKAGSFAASAYTPDGRSRAWVQSGWWASGAAAGPERAQAR